MARHSAKNTSQPPRDLNTIATAVATKPSIAKKLLRSRTMRSKRRAVQSKGAFLSAAAGAGRKAVSFGFGQIPLPVLGSVLDKAWGIAGDYAKDQRLNYNKGKADAGPPLPIDKNDKVKFALKSIGGEVADLDHHRFKIHHAIEQCNKAESETKLATCDHVVKLWAKRKYLNQRVYKLRTVLAAINGVTAATEQWLQEIEKNIPSDQDNQAAVNQKMASLVSEDHDDCSEELCMFGSKVWADKKSVPTQKQSDFFSKVGGAAALALDGIESDAIDQI